MKYALINCYTDNNKGDLGIILSTIKYLKKHDANAKIIGVSTYNYDDQLFKSDHKLLSQEIDVYPAIFGELNLGKRKSTCAKIIRFIFDTIKLFLFYIVPTKFLLNKYERQTFEQLISSDYVISKGGSFLCTEYTFRSKLAYLRFVYIFLLCFRLKKRPGIIILCQSLGPIHGPFFVKLTNYILRNCHFVVLREEKCIKKYSYIKIPKDKLLIVNDIAFHLDNTNFECAKYILNNKKKIGMTIKSVCSRLQLDYDKMIKNGIEYVLSKDEDATIYVFPHVTIDDDVDAGFRIYKQIDDKFKNRIILLTNNYSSRELKFMYGKMDYMISTRLHSAIFALGEGIPAINIAYHGTKSQGIYSNMGIEELLITEYSSEELIKKIDIINDSKDIYKSIINKKLMIYDEMLNRTIITLFKNECN